MIESLKIIIAQINPTVGDLEGNFENILTAWTAHKDADLIIFPELVTCGYPPEDLVLRHSFIAAIETKIETLLKQTKNFDCACLLTTPIRKGDNLQNGAYFIERGQVQAQFLKYHLPNYGEFDEKRVFSSGPLPKPLSFKGHSLGIMICEDMWQDDVAAHLQKLGAEILIIPNGSPFTTTKRHSRQLQARKRTQETGLPLIYVNQIGGQDELVFDGGSFIMNSHGQIKHQFPFFQDYIGPINANPSTDGPSSLESIWSALKLGIHDYVSKNNFPGVLIGLSGGIDSAITAVLAVDALGADKVHCVMMPSNFTAQESLNDAAELAHNLSVQYDIFPIKEPLKAFENILPALKGLVHENIQSRIRGTMLMALSNANGKMLLSTGNKSEMAVGYATIYGDMNGGFNALKDVYKTQVYELARWRNTHSPKPPIPENIITRAPSAELRADQIDQDSLPDYEELDAILTMMIEEEKSRPDIIAAGNDAETVHKVRRLLDRSEYKRRQAPPGVKITAKAFGRDRRYPMTNGYGT